MITLDLFETPGTPEDDPRPQAQYVPVNPEKPGSRNRALGNANLAILMKAINNVDMNNRPAPLPAKLNFLDGRSYTIDPKYYPAIIGYYRSISDVERVNFIYRTMVSYNKTIKFLNTLSQGTLFEKEEKKSSKYKDVAVQRAMRQAVADFPTAASDAEAFAKSMMAQQDQDKKNIDRLKSATSRTQDLIDKNDELDQSQARSIDAIQQEINKVEKDNDSLAQMVQQMSRANAELQDKLSRMRGKAPVAPATTTAPEPQLGVSVATDKVSEPEPAIDVSPIDIGARQKINDLSKSVTGALLQLKDKEQAQGLTPAEQERLEKLEKRLAQIEKAQSVFKGFKTKQAKKEKQAGDAAISAIAKAMGGGTTAANVKAVEPTNIQPAPKGEPQSTSDEKKSNVVQFGKREPGVVKDLVVGQTSNQSTAKQPETDLLGQQVQRVGEDLTHGLEEGSVFGQQDFDTQMNLAKLKTKLTQPKPAQGAPVAEPQPVPARLSDLQSRREKFANLADIKKEIERLQAQATRGGRILPRGLAADLEDYFTTADVDRDYEEMLAKYQKQLGALQQYLGMRKVLWSPKKDVHEMRANELQETKESPAWEEGGREGYYHRPNKNPYKPGTQEHSDYNRGYEHFKGDKDWDVPKRPVREGNDMLEMSDLEFYKELLAVMSIPVGIATAAVYSRVKNALDKYNANQIMRALDKKNVVLSREDVQKLRSLLDTFDRAIERNDGGNAKRIAQDIRELAAKSKIAEDTKSEFKAAALIKIKKALNNPKLDPDTRKDYETRLKKIQDLEEAKWKKETPWVKSTGKDPRGEVTHMSDVARKETERREREDSPMGQLFKDFEKVFGKKPPVKEGDVVNINRGGYNQFRDKNDFLDKRDYIQQQLLDPRQRDNYPELKQRLLDINYAGRKLGYIK